MAAYVLEGPRWGNGVAGTSGGTVTWSIGSTVPGAFLADISSAFSDWSAHANISFQQVASTASPDILFDDSYIDGPSNKLGQTTYWYSGGSFISANVTFDSSEGWHASGNQIVSNGGRDLFLTALHEIGHAIGLGHYDAAPGVMNTNLNRSVTDLTASDIGGVQALYGVPFGTISHDVYSIGGEVYALYDGLLDRAPDPLGGEHFAATLRNGTSLHDEAQSFLSSAEGQAHLGAADNAAFVEQLYETVLNRTGDAAGASGWVNALNQGSSRADVALSFVFSGEHVSDIQSALDTGVFVADKYACDIARLYYGVLGRAPDLNGLQGYTTVVAQGAALTNIAQSFLDSAEFQTSHAGLSDAAYVDGLYEGALGRHADTAALQNWTSVLARGASRADVAVGIAESEEAQIHLVGQIETGWHLI
jgi:hypothetical protein